MTLLGDYIIYAIFLTPVFILVYVGVKDVYTSYKNESKVQKTAMQRLTDLENMYYVHKNDIEGLKRNDDDFICRMDSFSRNFHTIHDKLRTLEKTSVMEKEDIKETRQAVEIMIKDLDKVKKDLNFVMKVS